MEHRRSPEKLEQRRIWQEVREYLYNKDWTEHQYASGLVLNYSYKDLENGEVVFTETFEGIVLKKLNLHFPDGFKFLVNYQYGDVLNRYSTRAPSPNKYVKQKGRIPQC